MIYNTDGPNISPSEIVNIVPGEIQISVPFTEERNWEALAFSQDYSTGRNNLSEERDISKYVHARLKCCDSRFVSQSQYMFHAKLD